MSDATNTLRGRLAEAKGKRYWRCLEELAQTDEFDRLLRQTFGSAMSVKLDPLTRRRFLTVMAASIGLAGLAGCTVDRPKEMVVPYVRPPEAVIPGRPLFFASTVSLGGEALGVLVESHEGRPTKIEGNQHHPSSRGATHVWAQAAVLGLYDPERSRNVVYRGRTETWDRFASEVQSRMRTLREKHGAGLRILTERVNSPTLMAQIESLLKDLPQARWHIYEPVSGDAAIRGAEIAFGRPLSIHYRFDRADVVLSLDSDFLVTHPAAARYAGQYVERRRRGIHADPGGPKMNRLYAIESQMSPTGAKADHRWAVPADSVDRVARSIAARLGLEVGPVEAMPQVPEKTIAVIAGDLQSAGRGRSLVIAGEHQPAQVHAMALAMNHALGNIGRTVFVTEPVEAIPRDAKNQPQSHVESLRDLVSAIDAGEVEMLVIVGGNPVYTAPADLKFADRLLATNNLGNPAVPLRIHLGLYEDETSYLCDWHLPEAHWLESWSDARALDGTASIVQPLIAPLYEGRTAHDVVGLLAGDSKPTAHDRVRDTWRQYWQREVRDGSGGKISAQARGDFETYWRTVLNDGVIWRGRGDHETAADAVDVALADGWQKQVASQPHHRSMAEGELEVVFRPDPSIYDGRFANNSWLQELPKPLTKITWGNVAIVSPRTAEKYDLQTGPSGAAGERGQATADVVELGFNDQKIELPVWIQPGHPDDSVTVHLGYGRARGGEVAKDIGANAGLLVTTAARWFAPGLSLRKTGQKALVACTQYHQLIEGRAIIREGTIGQYQEDPRAIIGEQEELPSLYPQHDYSGTHRWAMGIDLTACTGCNACVVACQAENNIPVVGKDEVLRGRQMHWLRIDRYYQGEPHAVRAHFQPLPCMHCENAPCEVVCPVNATVHSDDGLNDMVYNRCVGTRYCSNNCPYKVRRFNYFQYSDYSTESLKLLNNPNVTVRSRGVMEKCTYCVQRIRRAEIEAAKAGRPIADGDVVTACQAACPTQAIVFGDLNQDSKVRRWRERPLNYGLLAELNTRPRTTYQAEMRNPNPELENDE